jgi:hypothetical protein
VARTHTATFTVTKTPIPRETFTPTTSRTCCYNYKQGFNIPNFNSVPPGALAVDANGCIYVPSANQVLKFAPDGTTYTVFATLPIDENSQTGTVFSIDLDSEGSVYAFDPLSCRIVRFDAVGNQNAQFGTCINNGGEFGTVVGLCADKRESGVIFTADYNNYRIGQYQIVDGGATRLRYWGSKTVEGQSEADMEFSDGPFNIALDANGLIYVAATKQVKVFEIENGEVKFVRKWDSTDVMGCVDIDISREEHLFTLSQAGNSFQEYDLYGNKICNYTKTGTEPGGLDAPTNISLNSLGEVWTSSHKDGRVQKFKKCE